MLSCAGQAISSWPVLAASAIILWFAGWAVSSRWLRIRYAKTKSKHISAGAQHPEILVRENFDWTQKEPEKYRSFKPVYHITMALKADSPSDLITIDRDYLERVKLRQSIIAEQGSRVHGCVPGGEDAVREVYTYLLSEYLPKRYPNMFLLSKDQKVFQNLVTDDEFPTSPAGDACASLRIIGQTVEEDMFILHETPDGHFSDAFVCCFPSGFDPSAKLGKLLKDIHKPVPSYEKIGASMERFFSKLEVGKSVKRVNWTVTTHGRLFAPSGTHITEEDKSLEALEEINIGDTYFRCELQTLTRLPSTGSILFSFKTYLYPIADIKAEGLGPDLATAIEGLGGGNAPGMPVYKGSIKWAEPVCDYLKA